MHSDGSLRMAEAIIHSENEIGGEKTLSGSAFILEIEDVQQKLSARTLQQNPFWRAIVSQPAQVPDHVYFGTCIENYHLLFRESYFDSPILGTTMSNEVRKLINEFYVDEYGHDKLLLKSLEFLGISADHLFRSRPLRATMALCNALSYWARYDPVMFLTTLGPLEGGMAERDSFIDAARLKGLPEEFIGPMDAHANINRKGEHGRLTRKIFEHVPAVSARDAARVRKMMPTFFAIYDGFYRSVWTHYSTSDQLLRPLDGI